jgi:hypothetical protein
MLASGITNYHTMEIAIAYPMETSDEVKAMAQMKDAILRADLSRVGIWSPLY